MKQETIDQITAKIQKYYPDSQFIYSFDRKTYGGYHFWQSKQSLIEVYQANILDPKVGERLVWLVYVSYGINSKISAEVQMSSGEAQVQICQGSEEFLWAGEGSKYLSRETKQLMESLASEILNIVCSNDF
jgi:hypothetical protein